MPEFYEEIFSKFEPEILKKIDKENMKKILCFLKERNMDCIEDILTDYFDLFLIEYNLFLTKYEELNKKYNSKLAECISCNLSILEEFFE